MRKKIFFKEQSVLRELRISSTKYGKISVLGALWNM